MRSAVPCGLNSVHIKMNLSHTTNCYNGTISFKCENSDKALTFQLKEMICFLQPIHLYLSPATLQSLQCLIRPLLSVHRARSSYEWTFIRTQPPKWSTHVNAWFKTINNPMCMSVHEILCFKNLDNDFHGSSHHRGQSDSSCSQQSHQMAQKKPPFTSRCPVVSTQISSRLYFPSCRLFVNEVRERETQMISLQAGDQISFHRLSNHK